MGILFLEGNSSYGALHMKGLDQQHNANKQQYL